MSITPFSHLSKRCGFEWIGTNFSYADGCRVS